MAFRKLGWLMVALAPVVMTGCGSKTEPSKSNFANAIEDHLEKDGRFCVGKSFKFPVHLENKGTFGGPDNELVIPHIFDHMDIPRTMSSSRRIPFQITSFPGGLSFFLAR